MPPLPWILLMWIGLSLAVAAAFALGAAIGRRGAWEDGRDAGYRAAGQQPGDLDIRLDRGRTTRAGS